MLSRAFTSQTRLITHYNDNDHCGFQPISYRIIAYRNIELLEIVENILSCVLSFLLDVLGDRYAVNFLKLRKILSKHSFPDVPSDRGRRHSFLQAAQIWSSAYIESFTDS